MNRSAFSMQGLLPALTAVLGAAGYAQDLGRGSLGFNGLEPRLELHAAPVGGHARIRISDVAQLPGGAPDLHLILATRRARIPLDAFGLPGAVLGLDPAASVVVGPIAVGAGGGVDIAIPVQPGWAGIPLYAQVFYIDSRLPFPPLVFSDSRATTLGSADPPLIVATASSGGGTDLARIYPDGQTATPLPDLRGLSIVDLDLSSLAEERRLRRDLPAPARLGGRRALRLADGATVLLARLQAPSRWALLKMARQGRVEVLHAEPAQPLAPPSITPLIAASTFAPYLAFLSEGANPKLWLHRGDGSNFPASAAALAERTPAGASRLEASSLVFGVSVLAVIDRNLGLFLVPLDGRAARRVVLPPSGGGAPTFFDEEIAVSADGHTFALGAGSGRRSKDIYVVRDDGRALNVTQSPADYGEVGYSSLDRRIEISLDGSGTQVSYVNHSTPEPEAFLRALAAPSAVHMTASATFLDSIDIGSIGSLPRIGGALIVAGLDAFSLDLYYTPTGLPGGIVNLTHTSGNINQPPFGLNSTLRILDIGTLAAAPQYLLDAVDSATQHRRLLAVDAATASARELAAGFSGHIAALSDGRRLVLADGATLVLADPADPTPAFSRRVSFTHPIQGLSVDPAGDQLALLEGSTPAGVQLWRVATVSGIASRIGSAPLDVRDLLAGQVRGEVHLIVRSAGTTRLLRHHPGSSLSDLGLAQPLFFLQRP